jgi:hypothetical protein
MRLLGEGRFSMGMEMGNEAGGHNGSESTIWFLHTDYYLDIHYLALHLLCLMIRPQISLTMSSILGVLNVRFFFSVPSHCFPTSMSLPPAQKDISSKPIVVRLPLWSCPPETYSFFRFTPSCITQQPQHKPSLVASATFRCYRHVSEQREIGWFDRTGFWYRQ